MPTVTVLMVKVLSFSAQPFKAQSTAPSLKLQERSDDFHPTLSMPFEDTSLVRTIMCGDTLSYLSVGFDGVPP